MRIDVTCKYTFMFSHKNSIWNFKGMLHGDAIWVRQGRCFKAALCCPYFTDIALLGYKLDWDMNYLKSNYENINCIKLHVCIFTWHITVVGQDHSIWAFHKIKLILSYTMCMSFWCVEIREHLFSHSKSILLPWVYDCDNSILHSL